jgi:hypothetical protein
MERNVACFESRRHIVRLFSVLSSLLILIVAAFVAACSDDDEGGDDAPSSTPDASEPAGGDDGADDGDDEGSGDDDGDGNGGGGGSGSATLTIGDESWEFDGVLCAFSLEESQSEIFPFNLSAFGESSTGNRTQITADISDPSGEGRYEGEGVTYGVTLDDVEDFENPSVGWTTNTEEFFGGSEPDFRVDGKDVTVEAVFNNSLTEDESEAIPGTLTATCP